MKAKKRSRLTNDSSKQIEEQLDRVSFREIKLLWSILGDLSLARADFVRARFLQDGLHYLEVTNFLEQLAVVRLSRGQIKRAEELGETEEEMKTALIHRLLVQSNYLGAHLSAFLGEFQEIDGKFGIVMSAGRRRQFSGIRNLLLDLEFLEHDLWTPRYWVSSGYLVLFIETRSALAASPLELQAIIHAREKLGRAAEMAVLRFERDRLREHRDVAKRIRHVAAENVSAGYDILSFTKVESNRDFANRLIEVKAVSLADNRFYWSRNEVECARIHGPNYFLYLVPVSKNGFDMAKVRIIQNPHKQVYLNRNRWCRQEELISVWPMTSPDATDQI